MLDQFDNVTPSPAVTPWKMINARLDKKSPSAYNWRVNPHACRCRNARLLICKSPQDERWDEILMIFLFKNWVTAAVRVRFRTLGKHQREDKYTGFRWLPASLREIFLSDRFTGARCLLASTSVDKFHLVTSSPLWMGRVIISRRYILLVGAFTDPGGTFWSGKIPRLLGMRWNCGKIIGGGSSHDSVNLHGRGGAMHCHRPLHLIQ